MAKINNLTVVFICSDLCGGKSFRANELRGEFERAGLKVRITEISSIVASILNEQTREKLQGHPELDIQITNTLVDLFNGESDTIHIVVGVRQRSILKAFDWIENKSLQWIETPIKTRYKRFLKRGDLKDKSSLYPNITPKELFITYNKKDQELGLGEVENLIKYL